MAFFPGQNAEKMMGKMVEKPSFFSANGPEMTDASISPISPVFGKRVFGKVTDYRK